jgi:predicted RNA-binding Zn-ribbon protein involved in translation (DUF1610 family)
MSKLVRSRDNHQTSIQFQCGGCGRQFITAFEDIGKSYTCPTCGGRVNTLSVFCHYEGCGGRYEQCGGTIKKLSGEELAAEERKAFESEDMFAGATPTDSYHDDIGDIRASIITYRCDKCGDSYNASTDIAKGLIRVRSSVSALLVVRADVFPKHRNYQNRTAIQMPALTNFGESQGSKTQ